MSEQNAMDKAIAAAKEAAENAPTVIEGNTAVATAPAKPATALTLDDFQRETPDVDAWLKIDVDGFNLRDQAVDGYAGATLRVAFILDDFTACKRLNYGNPATYCTTFDGVYATDGQLWSAVVDQGRRATGNANLKDYSSVNVQGQLLDDAGGAKAGDTIGYGTSKTQGKPLNSLIKAIGAAGYGTDEAVEVEIGIEVISNSKGHKWAVHTYKILGAYNEE